MTCNAQIALHTVLQLDEAADDLTAPSYTDVSRVVNITPPAREREEAEARGLGDELDVPCQGGEAQSEMVFVQFWEPGDTDHERIDSMFNSKKIAAWRLVFPHDQGAANTYQNDQWMGYVRRIGPENLEATGVYRREIAIRRTGDLVRSSATITLSAAGLNDAPTVAGQPAAAAKK